MSDLQRITSDLTRCRQRIAEMESGQRGGGFPEAGESLEQFQARRPHDGHAFERQLQAQRTAVERLELEYVQARLAGGGWGAAAIIEAMERMSAPPVPEPTQRLVVSRTDDPIRSKLRELLAAPGFYLSRSKLEELLS